VTGPDGDSERRERDGWFTVYEHGEERGRPTVDVS
jgi:hypothetical protein